MSGCATHILMEIAAHSAEIANAAKCNLAAEVLVSFGNLRFAATGWSMIPSLWPGDILIVERVSLDGLRLGDIVLVEREGGLCAHRLIARPDGSGWGKWLTQGDAMPAPDRPLCDRNLLGRVTSLVRNGNARAAKRKLNLIDRIIAGVVRRSLFAARLTMFVRRCLLTQEESALPWRS